MEETNVTTEETTVTTEETTPNLEGVEIISNGERIDTGSEQTEEGSEETQETSEEEAEQSDPQEAVDKTKESMETAKTTLETKGVDYSALEAEYNEKGELSPESYATLEKAGYPKEVVNAIIAGWEASADGFAKAVMDSAGGSDKWEQMTKFVQGQGENAVNAFNAIMESSDLNTIKSYVAGVQAQMTAKYGSQSPTLTGSGMNIGNTQGFKDVAEMTNAMRDKRYGRDAEYTHSVEQRIANSKIFE